MYVSSMYHPKTTVLERPFQSDRLNCLIATVPPEEEVLGLKEAASVLEDKTDRSRPRATVPKQPFQSNVIIVSLSNVGGKVRPAAKRATKAIIGAVIERGVEARAGVNDATVLQRT